MTTSAGHANGGERFLLEPDVFREQRDPETGRRILQLTEGEATCYPLYYYIPSISRDGGRLVHHRVDEESLQLHVLDLRTGESRQLTHATHADTRWVPWCTETPPGVLDHRSVLNPSRDEVVYFDDPEVRRVALDGTADRLFFELPADRLPIGQNCVSGDGNWFVYIHHDRETYAAIYPNRGAGRRRRHLSRGTQLDAVHFDTGETRTIVCVDSPIHHVMPWGNKHFVFGNTPSAGGLLLTDIDGGWYTNLRPRDPAGGTTCHHVSTNLGVAYEVSIGTDGAYGGLVDPISRRRIEFALPGDFGYTHTGWDPAGRLWFFENEAPAPWKEPDPSRRVHDLWFLRRRRPDGAHDWRRLMGNRPCHGRGQKAHFHPQLTPDRNWILFTAGDPATQRNHLHLLDVSDLPDTDGVSPTT